MTQLVAVNNSRFPRRCYVNSVASNVVTNTTAETEFDQVFTFPAQSQFTVEPPSYVRIRAAGIFSTGLLNLGLTLRTYWGGTGGTLLQSTGSFSLPASQTDMAWWLQGALIIQSTGSAAQMEAQFFTVFDANASMTSRQKNTAPLTFDTTAPQDIVFTWQWATATANNSAQLRAVNVEIDTP